LPAKLRLLLGNEGRQRRVFREFREYCVAKALMTMAGTVRSTRSVANTVLDSARELSGGMKEMNTAIETLLHVVSKYMGVTKLTDLKKVTAA
jgi:hypothetical protein